MKIKTLSLFIINIIIVIIVSGCDTEYIRNINFNTDENLAENVLSSNTPVSGGTLNLSMKRAITTNPLLNEEETVAEIYKIIYEPLFEIAKIDEISPKLAENYTVLTTEETLIVNIKNGIYFHNGDMLKADDVIYSLNTLKDAPETAFYKSCINNIVSYKKISEMSVSITFEKPFYKNAFYLTFPIVKNIGENYYGTGAFYIDNHIDNKIMQLLKFENYHESEAFIDKIEVSIIPDKGSSIDAFSNHITDALVSTENEIGNSLKHRTTNLNKYSSNYLDFLGFNYNIAQFSDIYIRTAINKAIPKNNIVESVYLNSGVVAQTAVNYNSQFFKQIEEYNSYDIIGARNILTELGYEFISSGEILEKNGEFLQFSILVNEENEERTQIARRISVELKSLGIDAYILEVPFDEFQRRLKEGDFEMYLGGLTFSLVQNFAVLFGSSGEFNYSKYANLEIDAIIDSINNSETDDVASYYYHELQNALVSEIPIISIAFRDKILFTNEKIKGAIVPTNFNTYNDINLWFIKES